MVKKYNRVEGQQLSPDKPLLITLRTAEEGLSRENFQKGQKKILGDNIFEH